MTVTTSDIFKRITCIEINRATIAGSSSKSKHLVTAAELDIHDG